MIKELFLVEGESAALAVQRVCDPTFQAVLAMQGKPLNAWKASRAKVTSFPLFQQLAQALGVELGAGSCIVDACQFQRIVFLFDPDADGIHCSALMLWFFHRWLPELLASGCVVTAQPPTCELTSASTQEKWYPCNQHELNEILTQQQERGLSDVQRKPFRGLASLGSELLLKHCIHPDTRRLHRLRPEDAEASLRAFGVIKPT
jgi:DNA gyrase subunit B